MSSSHFDAAMKAAVVEEARTVWSAAQAKAEAKPGRRLVMLAGSVAGILLLGSWIQGNPAGTGSRLAFGPATVVSAESQGLGGGVEAVLLPGEMDGVPASSESPGPVAAAPLVSSPAAPRRCLSCEAAARARAARMAALQTPAAAVGGTAAAKEAETPQEDLFDEAATEAQAGLGQRGAFTLNVGSLFEIAFDLPVMTGAATAPVSAHVLGDVKVGDRVALPTGSRVVGEAFSTLDDDRAQVLLTAVVVNGKTVPLQGLALGPDDAFGVPGKVLRKGSVSRAGGGSVLRSVGRALSLGLIGTGSSPLADAAAQGLEAAAGDELQAAGQRWRRSDKIVRVERGTRVKVYLRSDLVV